jgi:hypothetical protein
MLHLFYNISKGCVSAVVEKDIWIDVSKRIKETPDQVGLRIRDTGSQTSYKKGYGVLNVF